ncbi:MAG: class I SAM-dependent methyltransferase [Candidatus Omnitrophica bacterium]|nr:class I SAM-dependent methyltransferase [Candidatus Omnitrophota bacterium]
MEKERNWVVEAAEPIQYPILEAGTGKGYFALALARKGYRFISFDLSGEMQKIAELHLHHYGLGHLAHFIVENGETLSFKNGSFGTVFSINMLHHLENPLRVMDELLRVLVSGGKLILCDFNDKGFAMMNEIHAREGTVHDEGKIRLPAVEDYLQSRGFKLQKKGSAFQDILIAVSPI